MGNTVCSETNYDGDHNPVSVIAHDNSSFIKRMANGRTSSPDESIQQAAATINSSFYPHYTCNAGAQKKYHLSSCYHQADVVTCKPVADSPIHGLEVSPVVDGPINGSKASTDTFTISCCTHAKYDRSIVTTPGTPGTPGTTVSQTDLADRLYGLYQEDVMNGAYNNAMQPTTGKAAYQVGLSVNNAYNSEHIKCGEGNLDPNSIVTYNPESPTSDQISAVTITPSTGGTTYMVNTAAWSVEKGAAQWSPNSFYRGATPSSVKSVKSGAPHGQNMVKPFIGNLPYVGCCEKITVTDISQYIEYYDKTKNESLVTMPDSTNYFPCSTTLGDPMMPPGAGGCFLPGTGIILKAGFCDNVTAKNPTCTSEWKDNPPPLLPICIKSNPQTIGPNNQAGTCSMSTS